MFQVVSTLAVAVIVMAITAPACAASDHGTEENYGTYNVEAKSHHIEKREWDSLSDLTAYFFIFALSCSALLFAVLLLDSFTGHHFVNWVDVSRTISRENRGVSLASLVMNPDALVSIINSVR